MGIRLSPVRKRIRITPNSDDELLTQLRTFVESSHHLHYTSRGGIGRQWTFVLIDMHDGDTLIEVRFDEDRTVTVTLHAESHPCDRERVMEAVHAHAGRRGMTVRERQGTSGVPY